tara:strand:+ start:1003 stop:1941 length:939 start_codon:yes stop_codon:yes gene_type:complete
LDKILIIGLGRVGIRHFESVMKLNTISQIDCIDPDLQKIQKASSLIAQEQKIKINLYHNFESIEKDYDFLVLATTADIRLDVLKTIIKKTKIKFSIFEKVLAQSQEDLNEFIELSSNFKKSWVNTPMGQIDLYKKLKKKINISSVKEVYFSNFRGLACNAIHFIDFVSSWKKMLPIKINSKELNKNWIKAERVGFYDIHGKLEIYYQDETKLTLISPEISEEYHCKILTSKNTWTLIEKEKVFFLDSGEKYFGKVNYQSEMTNMLVEEIQNTGNCTLPTLEWSVKCHAPLIESLLEHWNLCNLNKSKRLPIT